MSFSLPMPSVIKPLVEQITARVRTATNHISAILGYPILTKEDEQNFKELLERKIRTLYLFVVGASKEDPEKIQTICQELTNLVWMKDVVPDDRVRWYTWSVSDPLGLIIRTAEIRIKLLKGEPITATELAVISNTSSGNISHHIRSKNLKAYRPKEDGREWMVPADEALRFLKRTRSEFLVSMEQVTQLVHTQDTKEAILSHS